MVTVDPLRWEEPDETLNSDPELCATRRVLSFLMLAAAISSPSFDIRRIDASEAELLRDLRIEFAVSSPNAINANPAFMRGLPFSKWGEVARLSAASKDEATFLAWVDGVAVGLVALRILPRTDAMHVTHLWVREGCRRQGLGSALLLQALKFGQDAGVATAAVWATVGNDQALRLYAKHGFHMTEERRWLRGEGGPIQAELLQTLTTQPT